MAIVTSSVSGSRAGGLCYWRISTVRRVFFATRKRGSEHANESEVSLCRSNDMSVMPVKHVHSSGAKFEFFATRDVDNFTFAAETIVSFDMVLILQLHMGALFDSRVVEGEPDVVGGNHQSLAIPTLASNVSWRSHCRIDIAHQHVKLPTRPEIPARSRTLPAIYNRWPALSTLRASYPELQKIYAACKEMKRSAYRLIVGYLPDAVSTFTSTQWSPFKRYTV